MADSLYDTTDYRRVILDALEARGLTRRDLASHIERSGSWMSMALSGQRPLDPELVPAVAEFLSFDARATTYLAALVDLESPSPRARRTAWATVEATQAHRRSVAGVTDDVVKVHTRWYYPAIVELARCDGWRADPRWIAATLVPRITEAQAAEALTTLVRIKHLVPDAERELAPGNEAVWTGSVIPKGPLSEAMAEQHRVHTDLAARAIRGFRSNERTLSTVTMAIGEEHYALLRARLHELEREIVLFATEAQSDANRVYQLGIQLFPVSDYSDATHHDDH